MLGGWCEGGGSLQMITVLHRGGSSQMITVLHRGGPANDCGVKMKTRVHRDGIAK